MKNKCEISRAIAWQSYDCIDMLFILNRKNHNFYFFQDSGRVIVEGILHNRCIEDIREECMRKYEVPVSELTVVMEQFILLLQQEDIIHGFNSGC